MAIQNLINHIALVVDGSGSMHRHHQLLTQIFDLEIENLKRRSVELNQETRISVYLFNDRVECLVSDMDVMRMPSLKGYYRVGGQTALLDGTMQAIQDLKELPQRYGDHAFLVYVLTDGEENASRKYAPFTFVPEVRALPDHWTLACMVPDPRAVAFAKQVGFPGDSLMIWDAKSERGLEEVGRTFRASMGQYLENRGKGVRGTKSFFSLNLDRQVGQQVTQVLKEVTPGSTQILRVTRDCAIREFVEEQTGQGYRPGSAYYELVKPETIQPQKAIFLVHRYNGKIYTGKEARQLLSLPDTEVRVKPGEHGDWRVFVQSTSVNRKLPAGAEILVVR